MTILLADKTDFYWRLAHKLSRFFIGKSDNDTYRRCVLLLRESLDPEFIKEILDGIEKAREYGEEGTK